MSIRSEVVRIFNELLAGAKKITELTVATTPLSGTEKVEIVQGGESKQTTTQDIANLGGGGGGAVSSVNGQTGAVVLDLQDVMDEGATASVAGPVSIGNSTADDITLDAGSRLVLKTDGGTEQLTIGADGGWYLSGSDPGTSGQVITSNGAAPPTWENPAAAAAWGGITGTLSSQTDLQNALNAKLALAGGTMSGNIAMGNNKVTGLAAGTTAGDALRYEQLIGIQDVPIMASAMWPTEANGCTPLTRVAMATSLLNIQVLEFPVSGQTFAQVLFVLPRKYDNGTITAVIHWKPAATGSGDVRWGIQLASYRNDDALTGTFGTEVAVADTYLALNDEHITSATAAITPSGTIAGGNLMAMQINRDPGAGADTLDVGAQLISVVLRVTTTSGIDS